MFLLRLYMPTDDILRRVNNYNIYRNITQTEIKIM